MKFLIVFLFCLTIACVFSSSCFGGEVEDLELAQKALKEVGLGEYKPIHVTDIWFLEPDLTLKITAISPKGNKVFVQVWRTKGFFRNGKWNISKVEQLPQ